MTTDEAPPVAESHYLSEPSVPPYRPEVYRARRRSRPRVTKPTGPQRPEIAYADFFAPARRWAWTA